MPNIPHNYSITFRAALLLGSQCCVLRYAAAPLTPDLLVGHAYGCRAYTTGVNTTA